METNDANASDCVRMSSYRTYEEWKLGSFVGVPRTISVLTVPMRNGNLFIFSGAGRRDFKFLPYL